MTNVRFLLTDARGGVSWWPYVRETSSGSSTSSNHSTAKSWSQEILPGFCLLLELGAGYIAGVNGAAMICHLSPRDLSDGILEEFLIDTAMGQLGADLLNQAGITDTLGIQGATAVILMYGFNQGLQAGGTAYLGYVLIGPPPDEYKPLLDIAVPTGGPIVQIRHTSHDSGWVYVTGDVLFKFGRYDLRPRAVTVLGQVVTLLHSQGARKIMVNGYTDSIGPASFNMVLSRYRAKTVAEWPKRNMAPTTAQIDWQGRGAADPVGPNTLPNGSDNPAGRRRNRRVEIQFFKN